MEIGKLQFSHAYKKEPGPSRRQDQSVEGLQAQYAIGFLDGTEAPLVPWAFLQAQEGSHRMGTDLKQKYRSE